MKHKDIPRASCGAGPAEAGGEPWQRLYEIVTALDAKMDSVLEHLAGAVKSHYSVEEVAHMTCRADYTVRSWISGGLIRAERVAGTGPRGRLLVPREELARLIRSGRGAAVPAVAASRD